MKKLILPILIFSILGLVFAWQLSRNISVRAQEGMGEFQSIEAQTGVMGEPVRVVVSMTEKPRVLTQIEIQHGFLSNKVDVDLPEVPAGDTVIERDDSIPTTSTDAHIAQAIEVEGSGVEYDPGEMILFRRTIIPSEDLGGNTLTVGSPSVASHAYIVFQTGDIYAAISADGGRSFKYIDPLTAFPASYGGFCCNQVAIYVPSRDMFIWELEYAPSETQGGALRIAISRGDDILNGIWYYYDLGANPGYWYNFSDLALSNDYLYITTNGFETSGSWTNSYVFRMPLDALLVGGTISFECIEQHQFGLRGAHGASDVFYFAAHNSTSQVRVYKWEESAAGVAYADIDLSAAWYDNERICPGPDGKNWCGGMGQAGRILTGWVARGIVGFMWGSSQGGSFPYPYIEAVTLNASNLTYQGRPYIKRSDTAFIYPGASVNTRGDVAIVFNYGGGTLYPNVGYTVYDDFTPPPPDWTFYNAGSSTQGPNANSFGRYSTVRAFAPTSLVWGGSGYIINGCGDNGCADPLYFIFGRGRDMRSLTRYWGQAFGSFIPLVRK